MRSRMTRLAAVEDEPLEAIVPDEWRALVPWVHWFGGRRLPSFGRCGQETAGAAYPVEHHHRPSRPMIREAVIVAYVRVEPGRQSRPSPVTEEPGVAELMAADIIDGAAV